MQYDSYSLCCILGTMAAS